MIILASVNVIEHYASMHDRASTNSQFSRYSNIRAAPDTVAPTCARRYLQDRDCAAPEGRQGSRPSLYAGDALSCSE